MKKRLDFGVNDGGYPLGEAHHRAKLTDAQVEEIRTLHETGLWGYRKLAKRFAVSRTQIKNIVTFHPTGRSTTPAGYKSRNYEVPADFATRPDWWRYGTVIDD